MANLFVSYQRADALVVAHCLRYALGAAGHDAFVDTGAIPAGAAFLQTIDEAIARAELAILLIGPEFDVERLRAPASAVAFEWRRMRFHGCAVLPVYHARKPLSPGVLPAELRWICTLNARFLTEESFAADVDAIVAGVRALARPPRKSARVLWIDDRPANNEMERRHLRTFGLAFDNVVSTDEAVEQLRNAHYDLVITDMARSTLTEDSWVAGLAALEQVKRAGGPPVVVYGGRSVDGDRDQLVAAGAFGGTSSQAELYRLVDQALGRSMPTAGTLER